MSSKGYGGVRTSPGTPSSASAQSTSATNAVVGSISAKAYEALKEKYRNIGTSVQEFEHKYADMKGIDLMALDKEMRETFAKYGVEFKRATMGMNQWGQGTSITWDLYDKNGKHVGIMERSFSTKRGKRIMGNEYFRVDEEYQGSGMAKDLLAVQLSQAKQAGIDRIAVHANINVGGYTWARMGFQPNAPSMDILINHVNERIQGMREGKFYNKNTRQTTVRKYTDAERARAQKAVDALNRAYQPGSSRTRIAHIVEEYSDVLRPAWLGANWHGTIDLKDERNYRDYYNYLHSGKVDGIIGTEKRGSH